MDRGFPYDELTHCDTCNQLGAYDIYGDYICDDCLRALDDSLEVA